jgi:AcrR family transcriptional regulator
MTNNRKSDVPGLAEALSSENLPHLQAAGRRERRAAETRLRLFRCALQLFSERGFPNVTVEDITEAADVGKGTFFNYFESKDYVIGVFAEIQLGKVHEALEEAEAGRRSIQSVMHRLFQRVAEEPGRSPELARALFSSLVASDRVRPIMDRNMAKGRQTVARIVELGQQRGEIDPKLKKEQVALHLQQAFMGTVLLWSLHGKPKLQSAIEVSFQHFWRAIVVSG